MTQQMRAWAWRGVGALLGLAGIGVIALATWTEVDAQRHQPGQTAIIPSNAAQVCLESDPTTCASPREVAEWLKSRQPGLLIPRVSAPAAPTVAAAPVP